MSHYDTCNKESPLNNCTPPIAQNTIKTTCSNVRLYIRDANLPYEITHKYQRGMIIKERGFTDTTALCGGMITSHRYMILSNHMVPLVQFEGNKQWALYIANKDSRFLVLGKAKYKDKRTTVLLHLPDENWEVFKNISTDFAAGLLNQCFHIFKECMNKAPIDSVSTEEWLARCMFPIGTTDTGAFFPID